MLSKTLKLLSSTSKTPAAFLGGVAFGTLGLKLLASKEAKKSYAKAIAKGYKAKDAFDASLSGVKQHTDDVLAEARDIYEAEKKEEHLALLDEE